MKVSFFDLRSLMGEDSGRFWNWLVTGALFGWGYSLFLIVTGPHLVHFLPRISILRTLYYIVMGAVLFQVLFQFEKKSVPSVVRSLILLVVPGHAFVWLSSYSFLNFLGFTKRLPLALAGAGALFLLIRGMYAWGRFESSRGTVVLALFLVGLTLAQLAVVGFLPVSFVSDLAIFPPEKGADRILFPFSLRMDQVLKYYSWLLPEVPPGEKVVVLVLDAFREDFLGKSLSGVTVTPNLSRLAEENVYFPEYRVQAPATKASVASFFTGKYVREHGVFDFLGPEKNFPEPVREAMESGDDEILGHVLSGRFRTLAERFRSEGYATGGLVKIGHLFERFNYDQGFDFYTTPGGMDPAVSDLSTLNSSLFWMLREPRSKVFLYYHLVGPHYPYPMGEKNRSFWSETPYYTDGSVSLPEWKLDDVSELIQRTLTEEDFRAADEEVEFLRHLYGSDLNYYDRFVVPRFVEAFRQLGLYEEALFVVTSDHGENLYDHERHYGHAVHLYEETINVPLIMKLPDSLDSSWDTQKNFEGANVESVDLTASLLEYSGASRENISGESFLPLLKGRGKPKDFRTAFAEKAAGQGIAKVAVVDGPWKLIHRYPQSENLLFELEEDPGEQQPREDSTRVRSLLDRAEETLGSDTSFAHGPSWMKGLDQGERRNLEGLGYF